MKKPDFAISNRIRTLRFLAAEMTQKELADLVGVTRQTVNAIEANKYSPSLEVAFKIAQVFNVPITDVFSYSDQAAGEAGITKG
jgi:putative transcriptional regulator